MHAENGLNGLKKERKIKYFDYDRKIITICICHCVENEVVVKCCMCLSFNPKAPITTAADDSLEYFFSEEIWLDITCESHARQRIHKKQQALFSSKNEVK